MSEEKNIDITVSVYDNVTTSSSGRRVKLFEFLSNPIYKEKISALRAAQSKEEYDRIKRSLPACTPSGTFGYKRSAENLNEHSGYIQIDIDGKDNPEITDSEKLRDELSKIVNVAYCGLSAGGNGLCCIIAIPKDTDKDSHKKYFNSLRLCFENIGIKIDKSCSDVCRLRIVSFDKNRYLNVENAVVFTRIIEKKQFSKQMPSKTDGVVESSTNNFKYPKTKPDDTLSKVEAIVDKIESKGIDITGDHGQWLRLGFALAREFGEEGRDLFDRISRQSPLYNKTIDTDEQYTRCLNSESSGSEVTIGTFFHIAKEEGI